MSKRRWLRPKPRISYFEPEEPDLDEYVFCEKCGDFVYEYCSIHGALLVIPDDKVPANHNFPSFVPRAALTIPKVFLHLNYSSIPGAGLGVFTTLTLPKGVRFGPYRGVNTKEIKSDYSWQIYDRDRKPSHVVDASDGNKSNWMRFVNCSRHWREQNLVAFQYQGQLYYRTIKIIPRFTELMVFYGTEFAKKLHIDVGKYNAPKSYAQKFGARVLKKPNTSPKNKKTQDVPVSIEKEKETKTNNTTTINNTPTPTISAREKKNKQKLSKENLSGTQKEAPAKKRKTNADNKKLQPNKTIWSVEKNQETVREKIEDHIIKPGEDKVNEPKNKEISNIEQLNLENKQPKITATKENINSENDCTKPVVNTTSSNNKSIGKENVSAKIEQVGKFQSKEQNVELKKTQDFTCNKCNYQSVTKQLLENHMRLHDVNRKFVCETCCYRFSTSQGLNQHKLVHKTDTGSVKILECNICDYKTVWGGALQYHLRTHSGEKPHACSICDYKCSQTSSLKIHLRTHSGEKPHACSICDYKCSQANDLKKHLRTHSGEKPHACSICDYKCSQTSSLKIHLRTHSGEKPHACSICDYKCSQASHLKTHLKTHSGEKPHACSICDYKCSNTTTLKYHLKKKHLN